MTPTLPVARFALAPMDAALRILTWTLWLVPLALVLGAAMLRPPSEAQLAIVAGFVFLTYVSVWLVWRPTRFEVDPDALRIVWPIRTRVIPRADIDRVRIVSCREFRDENGWGLRIGVGGLWGGFGWLKTQRETYSMWISRADPLVIVRLRRGRPLLITPERAAEFADALGAIAAGPLTHPSP